MATWIIQRNTANMIRYIDSKGHWIEIYSEIIGGRKRYFADLITEKKIKSLGEFIHKENAIAYIKDYMKKH